MWSCALARWSSGKKWWRQLSIGSVQCSVQAHSYVQLPKRNSGVWMNDETTYEVRTAFQRTFWMNVCIASLWIVLSWPESVLSLLSDQSTEGECWLMMVYAVNGLFASHGWSCYKNQWLIEQTGKTNVKQRVAYTFACALILFFSVLRIRGLKWTICILFACDIISSWIIKPVLFCVHVTHVTIVQNTACARACNRFLNSFTISYCSAS